MISLKKKIVIAVLLCLTVLLGGFATMFLQTKVKAKDFNDNATLTVEKVKGYENSNNEIVIVETSIQTLTESDNIFMLNNANLETDDYDNELKEYLHIKLEPKNENFEFMTLNVQVKLKNLDGTFNIHSHEITSSQDTDNIYDEYFDLNNTYLLTSTSDTMSPENLFNEFDAQGLYTFDFSYWIKATDGSAEGYTANTSFYLLSDKYYVNPNDLSPREDDYNFNLDINNAFTEPRLYNTERIDRSYYNDEYKIEQNFFNFTNQYTTDYFGNATDSEVLLYPTLRFDATRYYVTWSKTVRGVTTTFDAVLNTDDYPKLVITEKNVLGTVINTTEITNIATFEEELIDANSTYYVDGKKTYTQYIATIEFAEIGEYTFNFHYIFGEDVLQASTDKLFVESENWNLIGSDNLSIYGYKLLHSEYRNLTGASESEMNFVTYEEVADETDFDRFNAYEIKYGNFVLTTDAEFDSQKTYYKRTYLMSDITNLNLNGDSILGQEINANDIGQIDDILTNNEIDESKIVIQNQIPVTNQAPIIFDYSSTLIGSTNNSFYYYFTKNGNEYSLSGDKNTITNDKTFTENGLYVVVLTYTNPIYQYVNGDDELIGTSEAKNARKVQAFVFEILNSEPEITIKDSNDVEILKTSGYTNQNVIIDWSNSTKSPFNVKPYVTVCYASNYEGELIDITSRFDKETYQNGQIVVSSSGSYHVRVDFGPCTYVRNPETNTYEYIYSASITYVFVIDKEAINGIDIYTIDSQNATLSDLQTNKDFALVYGCDNSTADIIQKTGKKISGANITVTYDFMPTNKVDDDLIGNISHFEDGNKLYIANNSSIKIKNENVTYNQNKIDATTQKTDSNVLTNDGIYIFHFVDEAGNTATKYVVKDTTSPLILQKNGDDYSIIPSYSSNQDNIVNTNTEIIFGTHKAILLGDDIELDENFETYETGNKTYLLVPVNNIYENDVTAENSNKILIYYRLNGNPTQISTGNYTKNKLGNTDVSYTIKAVKDNENLFVISVCDKLGNKFVGKVEMNFDKSLLMARVSGSPEQNSQIVGSDGRFDTVGDGTTIRLNEGYVSNKKSLNIRWIEGENDFEVVSVVAEFYPLTFEVYDANNNLNLNYPYSPISYRTIDLMQNTLVETLDGARWLISSDINLERDARYGEYTTTQGMYHVVRTYANSEQEDGVRDYYFYIDRNNLISFNENFVVNDGYIGNDIKMIIGDTTSEYVFAGRDFLQEFVTKYILQTNKQPVKISVNTQKYFFVKPENMDSDDYSTLLSNSKINVNQIRYKITDINGNTLSENSMNYSSDFTIKIFDNTSTGFEDGLKNDYTSLSFVFSVDLYNPVAYFVDNETDLTISVANQNSNISVNNTNVRLVWDNIQNNDLYARIDENDITIKMVLEDGKVSTIYDSSMTNIVEYDGENCFINLNRFTNIITKNCRLEITLKYQTPYGTNYYGNYLSSTKIIYFDFEKPKTNFENLINNDSYILNTIDSISSFEDYNSPVNFDNYAFAISDDWKLTTPAKSAFWQYGIEYATNNPNDVQTVWYRVYDKYADESGKNAQSIVPGDDRYDNASTAPTRYMFRPNMVVGGNQVYTQITTSLENFDFGQFAGKYVEIIEMDCAENYRIYTIYVLPDNAYINYEKASEEQDETTVQEVLQISKNQTNFEINNKYLNISKIENIGTWYMIDVLNGSTNTKLTQTIKVAPTEIEGFLIEEDALELLNNLIFNDSTSGSYYIIKVTSPIYGEIIVNYHTPGQEFDIDMDIRAGILVVTINQEKYDKVTYLTSLKVYEMIENNGQVEKVLLTVDSNNKEIASKYGLETYTVIYNFSYNSQNVRNLLFEYVDNFGQTYSIVQLLGVTQTPFEEMITFNGNYLQNEQYNDDNYYKSTEYYTNSNNVVMDYQPRIYGNIKIFRNGEEQEFTAIDIASKNIKQINIFSPQDAFGEDTVYVITFTDTSNRDYLFVIHHYLKTAEMNFVDTSNNYHDFDATSDTYESSISRIVYLQFDEYDTSISMSIKTTVSITRTYYDENGVRLTHDYGTITSPFRFEDYGVYVVTVKNTLGTVKTYTFEFVKSDATYYSVKANVAGKTIFLSPSEVKYIYQSEYLDHYVSIYDVVVDVNQERNLKVELLTTDPDALTKIYKISSLDNVSSQYQKMIAVTKISTSANITNSRMYLNGNQIIGSNKYTRTNEDSVILSLPAYYENESNLIKVNVIYGDKDLGIINTYDGEATINLEFSTSGIYYIYISDCAGNKHSFGGTPFYTLSLVNDFVYNLNEKQGIYNSIFNDSVEFTVKDVENFVSIAGKRFTISATLNGEDYAYTTSRGNYIFSDYGTYFVTLKGYINEISEENLVETVAKFSIINPNEAKFMHEYIGLNGYEITKIEKDGNDITDNIKEALNSATLNKFAIYGGHDAIGGNGNYKITVLAHIDDIVGNSEFTYSVKINKDTDVLILCNIPEGDSTTGKITLSMNLAQIYEKLGDCKIRLNGNDYVTINADTASDNKVSNYTLTANQRYNVTLETNSGNTILSFVVTKVEPLNSIAIIIIVAVTVVVVGLIVTFVLLRKRMRVR